MINRSFEAPIDVIFEMWTNPTHIAKWLPPTGLEMEYLKADIRTGGQSFYCMTGDNIKMYGKAHYLEITKPNRLVYTQVFCDAEEKISRHPHAPIWPETMLTTVIFTEEDPNTTRVTVTWEVQGKTTPAEMEFFTNARSGMTQGWTGTFDKLEDYLLNNSK